MNIVNFCFNKKMKKSTTIILFLLLASFGYSEILSQNPNNSSNRIKTNQQQQKNQAPPQRPKFPDRYAPLDRPKAIQVINEEMILNTVEAARQSYIKGLILLQKNDTANAIQYFESALLGLNKLASYPEAENNLEFKELKKNILEDYKNCVQNIGETILVPKEVLFGDDTVFNITTGTENVSTVYEYERLPTIDSADRYVFSIPSIDDLIIPVEENSAVDFHIKFLMEGKGKGYVPVWMERSSRWFPMMEEIAEQEGIPKEILLLSIVESGLRPTVESKAGALGLWQFMYPTGLDYGLNRRQSIWVDERRDPVKSTRAAMRYLRDLYVYFDDWYLTLTAYNWGWGNVRRALRQSSKQSPTFWDIRNQKNINMPLETREYVPLFIALMKITAEPEKYGIDVTKLNYHPEFRFDVVELEQATNLSAVAKSIGVGVEEIRELNPELLYDITPPDRNFYRLRVPLGSSKDFKTNFAKLSREEKQPSLNHKVLRGEDVITVAERFDVSIDELVRLNALNKNTIALTAGTDLKIPIGGKTYAQSTLAFANNSLISRAELLASDNNFHIAKANESVYSIATMYEISTVSLRNWNNLPVEQDFIEEGRILIISEEEANKQKTNRSVVNARQDNVGQNISPANNNSNSNTSNSNNSNSNRNVSATTTHTVRQGETISRIAERYKMTEQALRDLNSGKIRGDRIIVGDILIVNNSQDISSSNSNTSSTNNSNTNKNNNSSNAQHHTVAAGDTLYRIAKRHNTTVDKIISLNKNIKPDALSIGQRIRVK